MTSALQTLLKLQRPPVAVGFFDSPPANVPAWKGAGVPAGCVFWKMAQEGQSFYTVPGDHYNCAIGAHTHHLPLPSNRAEELNQTVQFMVESNYLALSEVPGIPTLTKTPNYIAYGPVEAAAFVPDVIVLAAQPAQIMLIYEAAIQAGISDGVMNLLGRPGCGVLPLAINGGTTAVSLGCKGNRTFTGLPEAEMYLAVPGKDWRALTQHLLQVQTANTTMETYYQGRVAAFSSLNEQN